MCAIWTNGPCAQNCHVCRASIPLSTETRFGVHQSTDGAIIVSSIHSAGRGTAPRRYISQRHDSITIFSGLPIDPDDLCEAHNARSLTNHWESVKHRLEGTYAVLRSTNDPERLEIQTDILGGEPIYYTRYRDGLDVSPTACCCWSA